MTPNEIEKLSFAIIEKEAGEHRFNQQEWQIVQRMIHTSADFEYIKTVRFHPYAISAGIEAIKKGSTLITDTNMAQAGIRKGEISMFGGKVICLIGDQDVADRAKKEGITRAVAAVDKSVDISNMLNKDLTDSNNLKSSNILSNIIYVVGNAPTALLRIIELLKNGKIKPSLIIGLPVGFVNAAESKDDLIQLGYPYISNIGRKGGSNVAASIVNALAIMAARS
ncbi:MAG: precorrin-8X methylmutase [Desulfamplus sp.]|nr:precorrin-8X methylmutase [Desulfamplus sp.]